VTSTYTGKPDKAVAFVDYLAKFINFDSFTSGFKLKKKGSIMRANAIWICVCYFIAFKKLADFQEPCYLYGVIQKEIYTFKNLL
jgi:hypothetical protein